MSLQSGVSYSGRERFIFTDCISGLDVIKAVSISHFFESIKPQFFRLAQFALSQASTVHLRPFAPLPLSLMMGGKVETGVEKS